VQDLLKELEEFAFRGIPDMRLYSSEDSVAREEMVCMFVASFICFQDEWNACLLLQTCH